MLILDVFAASCIVIKAKFQKMTRPFFSECNVPVWVNRYYLLRPIPGKSPTTTMQCQKGVPKRNSGPNHNQWNTVAKRFWHLLIKSVNQKLFIQAATPFPTFLVLTLTDIFNNFKGKHIVSLLYHITPQPGWFKISKPRCGTKK